MLIQELKESIVKDEIANRYGNKLIFIGEETYLQSFYIKQLAKKTKSKITFADDYLNIKRVLTINTMMDNSGIFVIRNSTQFIKNEDLFKNLVVAKGKYLILIFDKLDKRKSFFKENQNVICEFEKMTNGQLTKVIHKYLPNLGEKNCQLFNELIGRDYGRLLLEMDKLKTVDEVSKQKGETFEDDDLFELALREGLIYKEISDTSFQLADSILNHDIISTFNNLQELKRIDDDAFKLIGLLYSNFKNLLLYKNNRNINIPPFQKAKFSKIINRYNDESIIIKLDTLRETEQGIKTGKVDAEMALDYLVINLLFRRK